MRQQHPKQNRIPSAEMQAPQEKFAEEKKLVHLLIKADSEAWRYVTDEIVRPYILNLKTLQLLQKHALHPDAVVSRVYLNLTRNKANALRRFRFNCRLSSYLYYWIKDAVGAELRSARCNPRDTQEFILPDFLPEQGTTMSSVLLREEITETEGCLHRLQEEHPTHFCVLVCRTILQKNSKETADLLQRSVAWVDQVLHRAQNYMRTYRKSLSRSNPSPLPTFRITAKSRFTKSKPTHNYNIMNHKIQWTKNPERKIRTCMLMITHSCNLNCSYCYESFKSRRFMSSEMAKAAILKEAEFVKNNKSYDGMEIDLMGGEPMTNFDLIKELVEWSEAGNVDVPHLYFIISNGTLFTEEKKAWFEAHRESIVVGISYDGTLEMQNKNRKTGGQTVDREWFHRMWPFQDFHMTISQETLPHLAEGVLELQRQGYLLTAALAQGVEWNEKDAEIYEEQLGLLAEAYLQDTSLPPINLLGSMLNVMPTAEIEQHGQKKWCGSGSAMVTYDLDGKVYGCHMFSPIVLGERAAALGSITNQCAKICEDPFCHQCVLKMVCPSCAGFNYRYRGDVSRRDHRWCPMVLAQTRKAAEFQIKALANLTDELDTHETGLADYALKAYAVFQQLEEGGAPYKTK